MKISDLQTVLRKSVHAQEQRREAAEGAWFFGFVL
jgi:hypothetical protein